MWMKKFNADKIIFDKFTSFFYLAYFRLMHMLYSDWQYISCEVNSS